MLSSLSLSALLSHSILMNLFCFSKIESITSGPLLVHFNSSEVRYKRARGKRGSWHTSLYFNSCKVRYKQALPVAKIVAFSSFQFLQGTVQTGELVRKDNSLMLFQFLQGTVQTCTFDICCNDTSHYFNSSKVRYKL